MTAGTTPRPDALTARIPGSKSITNRALLLAACADGTSRLRAPLVSDDTRAFRDALRALGTPVASGPDDAVWEVAGKGRGPVGGAEVWCADAGTAARFLPPFAATGRGEYLFDGSGQLRARPLGPLTDALARLGARVTAGPGGGLPLRLTADGVRGGELSLDGTLSSQYLSGLLMAAPLMRTPLTVRVRGLVSRPYLDLTVTLMRHFGADVRHEAATGFTADATAEDVLHITPGGYRPADLTVEPDASTASYLFAAAAVTGRSVTVPSLGRGSLQGDVRFAQVLRRSGARVESTGTATTVTGTGPLRGGFDIDMGDISDTFMTLAAIAPPGRRSGDGARHRARPAQGVGPGRGRRGEPAGLRRADGQRPGLAHDPTGRTPPGPDRLPPRPPDRHGVLGARTARTRHHPRRSGVCREDLPRLPRRTAAPGLHRHPARLTIHPAGVTRARHAGPPSARMTRRHGRDC